MNAYLSRGTRAVVANDDVTRRTQLRLGIIGCGAVTQSMYARTLPAAGPWRVEAVCDLDPAAARNAATALEAEARELSVLLKSVDAVLIATPPSTHVDLVLQCLESVPLVFCEKPFVGRKVDAERLVAAADSAGTRLVVGHFRRAMPAVHLARDLVKSGAFGRTVGLRIAEGGRFTWEARSGYTRTDPFGGVLYDTGSHSLDTALYAAGLDEDDLTITVDATLRDKAEPAHEIRSTGSIATAEGVVQFDVRLSRYEAMANSVRVELERGAIDIPVVPGRPLRLWGSRGSAVLSPPEQLTTFEQCFVQQWHYVFGSQGDVDRFAARRFVGLAAWLEAIAGACA